MGADRKEKSGMPYWDLVWSPGWGMDDDAIFRDREHCGKSARVESGWGKTKITERIPLL